MFGDIFVSPDNGVSAVHLSASSPMSETSRASLAILSEIMSDGFTIFPANTGTFYNSGHLCLAGPDKGAAQDVQRPSDGFAILPCSAWGGRKVIVCELVKNIYLL